HLLGVVKQGGVLSLHIAVTEVLCDNSHSPAPMVYTARDRGMIRTPMRALKLRHYRRISIGHEGVEGLFRAAKGPCVLIHPFILYRILLRRTDDLSKGR